MIPPIPVDWLTPTFVLDTPSAAARLDPFDLVFLLTALAFNLLIAGIFIASKRGRTKLIRERLEVDHGLPGTVHPMSIKSQAGCGPLSPGR